MCNGINKDQNYSSTNNIINNNSNKSNKRYNNSEHDSKEDQDALLGSARRSDVNTNGASSYRPLKKT